MGLRRRLCWAACVVVVAACDASSGGEGEGEGDASEGEGDDKACGDFVPAPSDVCIPECGNALGVGQPCSRDGGECNDFLDVDGELGAVFCTADVDQGSTLFFCTKPCQSVDQCGDGDVVCVGDPANPDGDKGCLPAACVDEPVGEGEGEGEGE